MIGIKPLTLKSLFNIVKIYIFVPACIYSLHLTGLILLGTCQIILALLFVIFVIGPIVFSYSWTLQRGVLFLNYLNFPIEFNSSTKYVPDSCNYYVETDEQIKLGTWQILPNYLRNQTHIDDNCRDVLKNGLPVVIYMHGNAGNRGTGHRLETYKLLRKFFHVFAVDYRGYGDSTDSEPNEQTCIKDMSFYVEYVKNLTSAPLFIWGHSLGTGIATHVLDLLAQKNVQVDGLILESPFNNLHDEIARHPFSAPFRQLPWFEYFVTDPMNANGLQFESDKHILKFDAPVLIVHAEDDGTVPFKLGKQLYEETKAKRTAAQGAVYFQGFSKELGYGHNQINKDKNLPEILRNFVKNSVKPDVYAALMEAISRSKFVEKQTTVNGDT